MDSYKACGQSWSCVASARWSDNLCVPKTTPIGTRAGHGQRPSGECPAPHCCALCSANAIVARLGSQCGAWGLQHVRSLPSKQDIALTGACLSPCLEVATNGLVLCAVVLLCGCVVVLVGAVVCSGLKA